MANQQKPLPHNLMFVVDRNDNKPRLGLFDLESGAELELSLCVPHQSAGNLSILVCLGKILSSMLSIDEDLKAIGLKFRGSQPLVMNSISTQLVAISENFTDLNQTHSHGYLLPALIKCIGVELNERRTVINSHPETKRDK